jgi:response regulator RpfG family c-di-GMP phosphodiesterase
MSSPTLPLPEDNAARILVVDDEEVILESLCATLTVEGHQVVPAPNAVCALKLVEQQSFALLLTDQRMPEMTGLEFLARARQIQPDATRVLMTGVLELSTIIDCINKGELYRFIVKPWLREELLATVQNSVQRYELIRRNDQLQRTTQAMNAKLVDLNASLEKQVTREAEQNRQLAELNRALEQNLQRSVELCLRTMQTYYPRLGVQARRVHELCCCVAGGLKLSPEERQVLEISAWLHDIGLVGVPRRLITLWQKTPYSLNPAELALIRQHPVLGQELAGFVHRLSEVGTVIRAHHERFDGAGYPDGLVGMEIPWLGRFLAVAVAYAEAEFKDGDGLEALRRGSGTAFDPEAVRMLIRYRPQSSKARREREIPLCELQSGMVLAKGIYTANGVLLIPEGQTLSDPYIEKLKNHNRISPIVQSLLVYC